MAKSDRRTLAIQGPMYEGDTPADAIARTLTRPSVQAAATIQAVEGANHDVNALVRELSVQVEAIHNGDLRRPEGMLIAQAHTLDALFNNLARRGHANMMKGYGDAAERYFRLAFKAQSQCSATLERLAAIKNPPTIFAKQANVTTGPQQVNNEIPSRARETEIEQTKLLEAQHGEWLDFGTSGAAIGADSSYSGI